MTSSTEAAKAASQNQVTDADLLRICQSFNPGQDFDLAKAVRAEVLSKLHGPVAEIRIGVSATGRGTTICIMQPHADGSTTTIYSEMHPLGDSMGRAALVSAPVAREQIIAWDVQDTGLGRRYTTYNPKVAEDLMNLGENVRPLVYASALPPANAAPQASADVGITASHDVATVVAFIFERFGLPGYAGQVPANVVAAVRRLEAELQTQAGKDSGHLVGHLGTTVTDVMVASLASLAYRYAMTLSFAARNADCDQVEGIARRVTVKLKDEIRAIISGQSGSSS